MTTSLAAAGTRPAAGDPVDGQDSPPGRRRPALSPSRAADFRSCPLLYRLRVVDRLDEPASAAAARGTLVHAVLERLFERPPAERTEQAAGEAVEPEWQRLVAEDEALRGLVPAADAQAWYGSARGLLRTYFELEDPASVTPRSTELAVEAVLPDGTPIRGIIDRLDEIGDGAVGVVDYKTGRAPGPDFEAAALFQLKCYAVLLYRASGVLPATVRLLYLGDGQWLSYQLQESEILAFERILGALWRAVEHGLTTGDFPARRSSRCGWCSFQSHCPEFGGTPPPYPGPPSYEIPVSAPISPSS